MVYLPTVSQMRSSCPWYITTFSLVLLRVSSTEGEVAEKKKHRKSQTPENRKHPLYFNRGGIGVRDLEQVEGVLVSVEQWIAHSI